MTLTLKLTEDLESRLSVEAARRGISLAQCAVELLDAVVPETAVGTDGPEPASALAVLHAPWPADEPPPTTGAEIVGYWERHGLLGTRPDIVDSLEHARALRRKAERRGRD